MSQDGTTSFRSYITKFGDLNLTGSLKKRIMILTAFCVALSTLAIGALSYSRIRSETLQLAEVKLAAEARLLSQRFSLDYHQIANDLMMVAETPPIQGVIRSLQNGGIDPQDGSSEALWRGRLATIFQAVLRGRPEYFQFRYIGVGARGRELVRVDRTSAGLEILTGEDLQEKHQEPYFEQVREAPSGAVVFSDVSYNREHGREDGTGIPALRGMFPIDGPDGARYGFLVININYEDMLQSAFLEIKPQRTTFVINGAGDYMEHDADDSQFAHLLEIHDALTRPVPDIVRRVQLSEDEEGLFFTEDKVGYFVRDAKEHAQASANLSVVVELPVHEWYLTATQTRNEFLLAGFLVILVSTVFTVVVARSMMQPLSDLSNAVRYSSPDDRLDYLPVTRKDEIGELAIVIRNRNSRLIESQARASAIVNNVVDGLILIDAHGRIEQFNPSCERMFGYPASEIIGKNVTILMRREVAVNHASYLQRYRSGKGGKVLDITRELEAVDRSGRVFPIELAINAVTVDGETKFSGVIRDISQRKEIDRLRKEFVSTVSHELRTPLTSIRGSLTLIDTLASEALPPKVHNLLAMARNNTERLILLVNDILDFEKLHASKTQFFFEAIDLNGEVEKAVELTQGYAVDANVSLSMDLSPDAITISLDTGKFQQVLGNLISNAVKYSEKQGTVTLRTLVAGDHVRVEVEDRGSGIPESFRTRIFEPFSQADGSASRRKGGSGLGLNITRSLVEGMRGKIGFKSQEGAGTTFWIEFPMYEMQPVAVNEPEEVRDPGGLLGLHLEDDRDFHIILQSGMDGELELLQARTLAEARELLDKYRFDIVIIDRMIRDGEGLDLIRSIPDPDQTKIVVVTATDENVQHLHVDETLIKSKTRPSEFASRFAKIVDEIKAARQADQTRSARNVPVSPAASS